MLAFRRKPFAAALLAVLYLSLAVVSNSVAHAQAGNSSSITGTVADPTGAVVPNATVEILNPVSGYRRSIATDSTGNFIFFNVPFNPYHLTVAAPGFANYVQDVEVRSAVEVRLSIKLGIAKSQESVTVEAGPEDILENTPIFHTDVDRGLIEKLPLESASSSVSSLVILASPGVAADSNGLFHGLGDHAENSFSVDGQPITDQQSKVFSNQIPLDSIQSIEVISGAPPAEYGEKTSLVIDVTTRSGQGMTEPHGAVTAGYGSFGTSTVGFNLGYGGRNWGNFIAVDGLNTGRFLDAPEFRILHDHGNQQNVFDRVDYQLSAADSLHANFQYTRSWFQNPNSFDQQTHFVCFSDTGCAQLTNPITGAPLGPTDQRSKIETFNIAPSWTRVLNPSTLFTLGAFVRRDAFNYYPSSDPFADFAPGLQLETVGQERTLLNAGVRSNISYVHGIHNVKAGIGYQQTFLDEHDSLGIVDPDLNDPASPDFNPALAPFDLTRGGGLFSFSGHTDVKLLSMYVQDAITKGNWNINAGIRGDIYNGLTSRGEAQPRLGVAYNIKPSNTVLRVSYGRLMETPFNENLVISSVGCADPVLNVFLSCTSTTLTPLSPGWRNEFHAGLQQAFGKHVVFSGEYIWKYTHHAYDFGVLGNTPIAFPIEWDRSKISGVAGRLSVTPIHGFSALVVFSSVSARFFNPQIAGAGAAPSAASSVFRIDHDERFNQTTHIQYQPWKRGPWIGFNWRLDSGLAAGAAPFSAAGEPVDTSELTADQQFQAGLFCGSVRATSTTPIPSPCPANLYGSTLLKIPAPGTEDDDKNPPRVRPRHLFDLAVGHDNVFNADRYKVSAQFTVVNLANEYALYNFLSTFSGTHYVTPRSYTGQIGFHF